MKKINNYLVLAISALAMMACSENDSSDLPFGMGREMKVVPAVEESNTGITDINDVDNFYFRISGSAISRYDCYALMERNGNVWSSYSVDESGSKQNAKKMLWADNHSEITATALYAPGKRFDEDSFCNPKMSVIQNQSSTDSLKQADWLYMAPTQFTYSNDGSVNVDFSHLMSKLTVTFTLASEFNVGNGTTENPITKVRISTNKEASYDLYTNIWTSTSSEVATVTPCLTDYKAGSGKTQLAKAVYECILLPGEHERLSIEVRANGNIYNWMMPQSPCVLESNHNYRLPITIGKDYMTVGDILVSDWDEGSALGDGESDLTQKDVWDGSVAQSLVGSGTKDDPFRISKGSELAYIAKEVNARHTTFLGKSYFELMNDIDLANLPWTPIGFWHDNQGNSLYCNFEGNGHAIYNVKVNSTANSSVGFFGSVSGEIRNLTIINADITGQDAYAGILAGCMMATSSKNPVLTNCHVSGKLTTTIESGQESYCGGMLGYSTYLKARGCTVNAEISGGAKTGGFCGEIFNGDVDQCSVRGSVEGSWATGGFFGVQFFSTTATNCTSYATVNATDWHTGGFVGFMEENCQASNCVAYGDVNSSVSESRAGGFVGGVTSSRIYRCSAMGKVTAQGTHGAFIGYDHGSVVTKWCIYNLAKNSDLKAIGSVSESSSYDIVAK